jgi:hypothetical protein
MKNHGGEQQGEQFFHGCDLAEAMVSGDAQGSRRACSGAR